MFSLTGNKAKCKLKPIFQSYTEEGVVYLEEIDRKRKSTDCVINGDYDKERDTYSALIFICRLFFFFLASFTTSIFTLNSPGTDSKGDVIQACQGIRRAAPGRS